MTSQDNTWVGGAAAGLRGPAKGGEWTLGSAYVLGMLSLVGALNIFDRKLLNLVLPLIKADLKLTDTQLGLASGLAFAVSYSLMGIPIARLADRWNRRNIIAGGLAFWSIVTAFTGAVTGMWQLVLARLLLGVGEASTLAPSNAIIGDLFSKARRPLAVSTFAAGVQMAGLIFTPLGALVAQLYGWRAAFVVAGIFSFCAAVVFLLTVREPRRGAAEEQPVAVEPLGLKETARFLAGSRSYWWLLGGSCLVGACVNGVFAWNSMFLVRVHQLDILSIGAVFGPVQSIVAVSGTLFGGYLADRLGRRHESWRVAAPGLACIAAGPALALYLFTPSVAGALAFMGVGVFLFSMQTGPVMAAIVSLAKPQMRATAIAALLFGTGIVGQVVGAVSVGALNDLLDPVFGTMAIRYSMLVVAASVSLGGLAYLMSARRLGEDTRRVLEA